MPVSQSAGTCSQPGGGSRVWSASHLFSLIVEYTCDAMFYQSSASGRMGVHHGWGGALVFTNLPAGILRDGDDQLALRGRCIAKTHTLEMMMPISDLVHPS